MNPMRSLVLVLVLLAAVAGTAVAATPERVFASKTATGGFASVKVSGTAKLPATLRVRITAVPRQNVLMTYTVLCSRGATSARKVRQFGSTMTPTARSVPFPIVRPGKCTLSATGQLEQGEGKITIQLLSRTR